jgi:hypothetical protein
MGFNQKNMEPRELVVFDELKDLFLTVDLSTWIFGLNRSNQQN